MPYARPTLSTLQQQAQQDISGANIGVDGFLTRAIMNVMALVQAGFAYLHYDYQDYIALQSVPFTATGEYLDGWAALKGVTRKPPTQAVLTVTNSGLTVGASIPAGTGFTRGDGAAYASTAATVAASDGTATVTVQAVVPGSAGNCAIGSTLTLSVSIAGVQANGWVVASAVTTASDTELDDSLRTRMLDAFKSPGRGGDIADWQLWALSVPGVSRAWIAPNAMGAGTVVVFFMMDTAESLYAGFPQGTTGVAGAEQRDVAATGDQLTIANALYPQRPVTSLVYVSAPAADAIPFTIAGLGAGNTTANQTAINAALTAMFLDLGNVGGTIDPNTSAAYPPIAVSTWYAAIAAALGNNEFTVVTPTAPITPAYGQLPVLGTVTYQS